MHTNKLTNSTASEAAVANAMGQAQCAFGCFDHSNGEMTPLQEQALQGAPVPSRYRAFAGDVQDDFEKQYARLGDVYESMGDSEEGAVIDDLIAQYIGDVEDGDVDSGDTFDMAELAGDVEIGGPKIRLFKGLRNRMKQRKAAKKASRRTKSSLSSQLAAERAAAGKINPGDKIPFISAQGMVIQTIDSFPAGSTFLAESQKACVDRCQLETPGVGIVISSGTPATQFGTSFGATTYNLFPFFVIKIGTNMLNGVAGTVINITMQIPTINGTTNTVVVTAQMTDKFNGSLVVYPYILVAGRPMPVLGKVGGSAATTDEILVTITGLPASVSTASLIVPQSNYPLFIAYRNALIGGN